MLQTMKKWLGKHEICHVGVWAHYRFGCHAGRTGQGTIRLNRLQRVQKSFGLNVILTTFSSSPAQHNQLLVYLVTSCIPCDPEWFESNVCLSWCMDKQCDSNQSRFVSLIVGVHTTCLCKCPWWTQQPIIHKDDRHQVCIINTTHRQQALSRGDWCVPWEQSDTTPGALSSPKTHT